MTLQRSVSKSIKAFPNEKIYLDYFHLLLDNAGQNKQHQIDKNTAKLDRETEELHHNTVPVDVARLIQQSRQAKGLTQKDLATVIFLKLINLCRDLLSHFSHCFQKINEKPQVVNDYENGRAIPSQAILAKMEKILGM